jgi:hypothetical protein
MEIILQEAAFERTRVLKTAAWRTWDPSRQS